MLLQGGAKGFHGVWLLLIFPQLLESCHHVGCRNRVSFSSVLYPSLDELLYKLLNGIHSVVKQECKEVADQQPLAEGDPEHLVLTQAKPLPDPLDVPLVPQQDRAGLRCILRLLGFLAHTSILSSTSFRSPTHFLLPGWCQELAALLEVLTLLQLLLPEVAAHHRVAVLVDAIGEVLAGHTDHATFPFLQVTDKDTGVINWNNAELLTHIAPRA